MKKRILVGAAIVAAYFIGTMTDFPLVGGESLFSDGTNNRYININECIPISDIDCCWMGNDGYLRFSLGDVGHINDDFANKSYAAVASEINSKYRITESETEVHFWGDEYDFIVSKE